MDFRDFYLGLPLEQRRAFAERAATTLGYLTQVAYGNKQVDLGLADVLIAVSGGQLKLENIPLTPRAQQQAGIRAGATVGESRHAA